MDYFKETKRQINDVEKAEARRIRKALQIEDVSEHNREARSVQREALLPKDRVCPRCGEKKLDPQQWVVLVDGAGCKRWRARVNHYRRRRHAAIANGRKPPKLDVSVLCKSCSLVTTSKPQGNPFTPIAFYNADCKTIREARKERGLTGTAVAEYCGWSQPKQSMLEARPDYLISETEAALLARVLKLSKPPVVGEAIVKYHVDAQKLRAMREALGVSRSVVAKWLGVRKETVSKIERKSAIRSGETARAIIRGFREIIDRNKPLE